MRAILSVTIALIAIFLASCGNNKPPARLAFEDKSSLIPSPEVYGDHGALWGDFNNDALVDLIYMGHGGGPFMLSQTADHAFDDVTATSGIRSANWEYSKQRDRHGASCGDFDNDGNLDLFISHGAKRGETLGIKHDDLLRGNGDFTFSEVTRTAGTLNQFGRSRSSLWFDYNKDGWIDLYVLNLETENVMYKNNGDGTFTDVTATTGLGLKAHRAAPADFDQDGNIDLLLAWPLRLYKNDGAGHFVEIRTPNSALKGVLGFDMSWGDADNDGDLDIFVSRAQHGNMLLLINEDGHFRNLDLTAWTLDDDDISTGVSWADMDNDGLLDIVNVRSDGYFVYLNDGKLSFSVVKLDAPVPSIRHSRNGDAALADFNNDGLLDIATDDPQQYMLLQNTSNPTNNWLKLQFHGIDNNRLGIGNKVWISSKGKLIAYREYTGTTGHMRSTSCDSLHLGLGQNAAVDIRVQWLNGDESVLENVTVNQSLTISDADANAHSKSAQRPIHAAAKDGALD